ncbi:MAG: hypothetical protein U0744_10805 [Gemmataceae bacterium]
MAIVAVPIFVHQYRETSAAMTSERVGDNDEVAGARRPKADESRLLNPPSPPLAKRRPRIALDD